MNKKTFSVVIAVLTFVVGVGLARLSLPDPPKKQVRQRTEVQLSNYRLSGPYEHENLSIFLIHGPDQSNGRLFTPLQDAMERKVVMVHETSNVNELAIENVSRDEEVLVQAGDIVKGGRQDRALAVDLILPAKSGKIPIAAFCVEHGRWQPRGAESADHFTLTEMAASKDLKTAIKDGLSQLRVWDEVGQAQESLGAGVAADVRMDYSRSSFAITIENEKVQEAAAAYVNKLSPVIGNANDVLGFAFAINNNLNGADVYFSNAMFKKFWIRLLKAAAIEAVSAKPLKREKELISTTAAGDFLVESERGEESLREITARTHMVKREAEIGLFFETRDMAQGGAWVHRSYLSK